MRYARIAVVLILMSMPGLIGYGFEGQTGHHHPAIHLDNAWARRTPPMAQQEQGGQERVARGARPGGGHRGTRPRNGVVPLRSKLRAARSTAYVAGDCAAGAGSPSGRP